LERKARPRIAGLRPKTKRQIKYQPKRRLQSRMPKAFFVVMAEVEIYFGYATAERMRNPLVGPLVGVGGLGLGSRHERAAVTQATQAVSTRRARLPIDRRLKPAASNCRRSRSDQPRSGPTASTKCPPPRPSSNKEPCGDTLSQAINLRPSARGTSSSHARIEVNTARRGSTVSRA
jgi:hypothetical protein